MTTFLRSNALPTTLSIVALCVATLAFLREAEPAEDVDTSQLAQASQLKETHAVLAALQERVANLESRPLTGTEARREAIPTRNGTELKAAIAKLTTRVKQLEQQPVEALVKQRLDALPMLRAALGRRNPTSPAERKKRIEAWRVQATNAGLDEEARLEALRALRGAGKGARGGAVLDAMVQLAQTSKDPSIRADVWRQMSGARDPKLVQPLVQAALHDTDRKTREEAIETLGDYLTDASARQTLEHIKTTDANEDIREEAEKALRNRRKR